MALKQINIYAKVNVKARLEKNRNEIIDSLDDNHQYWLWWGDKITFYLSIGGHTHTHTILYRYVHSEMHIHLCVCVYIYIYAHTFVKLMSVRFTNISSWNIKRYTLLLLQNTPYEETNYCYMYIYIYVCVCVNQLSLAKKKKKNMSRS